MVRSKIGSRKTRPTSWGHNKATKCQKQDWQQKDQNTYKLRVEQSRKMVRSRISSRNTQPLTACGQNKATKQSGVALAVERPDHLQAEGRTMPQNGQEQHWLQKDHTTYSLKAEDHKMVRSRIGCRKTRPLTIWRQNKATKMVRSRIGSRNSRPLTPWGQNKATVWSGAAMAAERPDHLLAEGRTRP
jgi:hypothetical protein